MSAAGITPSPGRPDAPSGGAGAAAAGPASQMVVAIKA